MRMHLASGDIEVQRSRLPEGGQESVDATVRIMAKMAKGEYGSRSAKIRALAINIINAANVADKDYYGMAKAIHEWVRDNIRYVKDPIGDGEDGETLNQETLSYPEETAFNSMAGDCDDKTILEIALLGSLGLQSYPVVIGTQPGRYNHVYLNIVLPPGKYPHAGETIPADPIMREWPLGKEAPAAKVKLKKLYTDLSGLSMDLGAYASAPSYLDNQNIPSVGPVLNSKITDTGGRGQIMNVKQLTRPSDDLDDMFSRPLVPATQPVQLQSMYNRGPITAFAEKKLTSYLQVDGAKMIPRRSGIRLVEAPIMQRHANPPKDRGPTVGELCGLADFISSVEHELDQCDGFMGVAGPTDPLHKAAAASAYAHARARKASQRVDFLMRGAGMFGLGEEQHKDVIAAQKVEAFAHTIAKKANAVAAKGAKSPARKAALKSNYAKLKKLDRAFKVADIVAKVPRTTDHIHDAAIKVQTLAKVMHSGKTVNWAHNTLVDRGARAIPGMPLKTPLKNAVVRDQFGRVIYSSDLGKFSFKSVTQAITKPITKATTSVTKSIAKLPAKIMTAPVKLTQGIVKAHMNVAQAMHKSAMSLHNMVKPSAMKGMFKKPKGAPGQPAAPAAASNQPYTDPSTGYVFDPATNKWTDPATGDVYDPATGQWTFANQAQQQPVADPAYDPNADGGGGGGTAYDPYGGGSMYQPGADDPNAQFNFPDPFTDQEGVGPAQSEDFPEDGANAQGPMPGSEFDMAAPGAGGPTAFDPGMDTGPQDSFGPEDVMTSSESDWGNASADESGGGFDPNQGADDGSYSEDDDATESYPTSGDDRRQVGPWGPIDGLGDAPTVAGVSVGTLALVGLGAYLLLKRK